MKKTLHSRHSSRKTAHFSDKFIALVIPGAWAVSAVISLLPLFRQLSTNPNISAFYVFLLDGLLLPILAFCGVWLCNPRSHSWAAYAHTVGITAAVLLTVSAMQAVVQTTISTLGLTFSNSLGWWYIYLVTSLSTFVAVFAILIVARRSGRWV